MRIPVFARGSNPAIDRPNQRKSESYGAAEVEAGRADWIDPNNHARGIWCRDFLYSGQRLERARPEQFRNLRFRSSLPPLEVGHSQFDDPVKSFATRESRSCLVVRARAFARFCDLEFLAQA